MKSVDNQKTKIDFIHPWVRKTRSPFENDTYRVCWYFNHETMDYIYEHKNEKLCCNGFSISAGLCEQMPDEFQKRYFGAGDRGLLFIAFGTEIAAYIFSEASVTDDEFLDIFGLSKTAYFAESSFDSWEKLV